MKRLIKSFFPASTIRAIVGLVTPYQAKVIGARRGVSVCVGKTSIEIQKKNKVICISRRHAIYCQDIINSFDYYFDAVEPVILQRSSQVALVDYSLPRYHEVRNFDMHPVFFPSLCEPIATTSQYLGFANLKHGSVVIDLGAYSGLTSIVFKENVGSLGKVVAVDADEENCVAIKKNFELYKKLTGNEIEFLHGAVWSHCDGLSFSSEGNMGSSATEIVGGFRGNNKRIKSFTLSKLTDVASLSRVDFIKCDIEGAESVIFEDESFFKYHRPRIIIETHIIDGIETTRKCTLDLQRYGYSCRRIEQRGVSLPLIECYPEHSV